MVAFEIGSVVVKVSGNEAGRKAVITDIIDRNYVCIVGSKEVSGVKSRIANLGHLEPTGKTIPIEKGASDELVRGVLTDNNLIEFMKERVTGSEIVL